MRNILRDRLYGKQTENMADSRLRVFRRGMSNDGEAYFFRKKNIGVHEKMRFMFGKKFRADRRIYRQRQQGENRRRRARVFRGSADGVRAFRRNRRSFRFLREYGERLEENKNFFGLDSDIRGKRSA